VVNKGYSHSSKSQFSSIGSNRGMYIARTDDASMLNHPHKNRYLQDEFEQALKGLGFTVYKKGWPDFLVEHRGKLIAVEHKNPMDHLTREQEVMHRALRILGVRVITAITPSEVSAAFFNRKGRGQSSEFVV
jgi:hypothetical protein